MSLDLSIYLGSLQASITCQPWCLETPQLSGEEWGVWGQTPGFGPQPSCSQGLWTQVDYLTLYASVSSSVKGRQLFSSVQSLSRVRLFVTPWTTAHQASLSITNSQSLPKPMSSLPNSWVYPNPCPVYPNPWVSDAIQPSHPLSSPSSPALNLSQHQGLFKWLSSSHQVAKVLEFQLQHHSYQWTPRTDLL